MEREEIRFAGTENMKWDEMDGDNTEEKVKI